MLTSAHAIVVFEGGRAVPDRLSRQTHRAYRAIAERMLAVYRTGASRTRRELHRSIEGLFSLESECPARRIQAFCKLLDDASEFAGDREGEAAALRLRVFTQAAARHPLVEHPDRLFETGEHETKALIARAEGCAWEEIEAKLYADVLDLQPLLQFHGYPGPEALLSRYNVAQLQACLYRAERVRVIAREDFKTILRYVKFSRLLHEIRRTGPSEYRLDLAGPATVLRETRRYGVQLARFLPALLACREWTLDAVIRSPWKGQARLRLTSQDGFRSHLPPPEEFDSSVEEAFARKFGPERDGWTLVREGVVLHEGQVTFVPDFVFRHADGTEVCLEIVGFWTPEYLAEKRETLRRFARHRILLAVAERYLTTDVSTHPGVLAYKTAIKVGAVLEKLEALRR